MPCAGWVTEETVAPAANVSLVKTLNVALVSSAVVALSGAISITGLTVIATVFVTAGAVPSEVETLSVVEPFQSGVGANFKPASAAVTAAGVPEMVTVPELLPVTVTPETVPSVSLPLAIVNVVVTLLSASATTMALPFAELKVMLLSSFAVCNPGTELTGASLTAATLTVTVAVSVTPPDVTL